jgi:PKD repeat protein
MSFLLKLLFSDDFGVSVIVDYTCEEVGIEIDADSVTGPFSLTVDFGDEDEPIQLEVDEFPHLLSHTYPGQGEYEISVKVIDSQGLEGEVEQDILLEGPEVTLESDPFPPLVTLVAGEAAITFEAIVDGGTEPYTFEWDLNGDEISETADPTINTAEFTYTEAGKYKAHVSVTDECGFSDSDKLSVVVIDDEEDDVEEQDGEKACHPMAEKIAQALSSLPNVSGTYDCNAIYEIFRGITNGGATIGFGRLWHAYQLAAVIPELTWEEIRDWKLDGNSWGLLNQLSKFVEAVEDVGIREMVELVLSGENSAGEIRAAMRMTLRYEAGFYDALGRIGEGASNGELGQFYKLAQEMEMDPSDLDAYLGDGTSISELRHAFKFSSRSGLSLDEILTAHGEGSGWGEINQAHRLADESVSVGEILEIGVNEYRKKLREEERSERTTEREEQVAARLAEKFDFSTEEILSLYNGECEWDWGCVRGLLRNGTESSTSDKDARTLERIADQYGVSQEEVSSQLSDCSGDWTCVRAHFRELSKPDRGKK